MEQHLGLVEAIARKILRSLPAFVDAEDLIAFGQIGLIEASRRYDPSRGVLFKTFSYYRIRGAIYDGIRKMSWFAASPARKATFQGAANELMAESGESGQAGRGLMTVEEQIERAKDMIESIATAKMLSMDAPETPIELPDEEQTSALEVVEIAEMGDLMRVCVGQLEEKERSVIEDYYFNHMTLEEAGAKLGLSKSWTSRLHARALKNLMKLVQECGIRAA